MKRLKAFIPVFFIVLSAVLPGCGGGGGPRGVPIQQPGINAGNQAPVAKAGADQTVSQNTLVTLNGSASSDPDGNAITYAWTQTSVPAVTLSGAATSTTSFTPTQPGTYTFQLIVSDGSLSSAPDSVSVSVNESNCGNSVSESGEACDDGNTTTEACAYGQTSCIVCNSSCQNEAGVTSYCGDGTTNAGNGEICDDGENNGNPSYCNLSCGGVTSSTCGNGVTESGEACDTGSESATCDSDCTAATCGDGSTNATAGETCDNGTNNGQPNYCNLSCSGTTSATCGNSVTESGETCDDGNTSTETCTYGQTSCTVCNSSCMSEAGATSYCGDGAINASKGETCDDSNTTTETCTYGQTSCTICDSSCTSVAGAASYCGDSITNAGNGETCDDGNTTTETCASGQNSCTICNSSCQSVAGADITAPSVTLTFPVNSAVKVPANTKNITATFSEVMNPDTLTTGSFTLECPAGSLITGTAVAYPSAGNVATLTIPAAPNLPQSTVCTATVTAAAKDLAGNALVVNAVWSFTTGTLPTDFESFALGEVNGQYGWTSGHESSICPLYDVAVVSNIYGLPSFESQSLRISDAITCTSFRDMTFSKSLVDEAGETSASTSVFSGGTRQPYFEAQWDFASTVPGSEQPGLSVVASPDRGDGGRMSWVQMQDTPSGLQLNFYDYQHSILDFVLTPIATGLDRMVPHTVKITMQFIDGVSNDVVKVYLDGSLIHTGTSWEDYFRDFEGGVTRPVDSIMFRTAGAANPANLGKGFIIDNFSSFSGPVQN